MLLLYANECIFHHFEKPVKWSNKRFWNASDWIKKISGYVVDGVVNCCSLDMHLGCRKHTVHFLVSLHCHLVMATLLSLSGKIRNYLRFKKNIYCWHNIACESCHSAYDAVCILQTFFFININQTERRDIVKTITCYDWNHSEMQPV